MGRIGYRKSRNGCVLCKKRRVKCDEKRPCSACEKNGVQCSLTSSGTSDTSAGVSTCYNPYSQTCRLTSSRTSSRNSNTGFPSSLDPEASNLGIMDLELMHHWTTGTASTIPVSSAVHHVHFKEYFKEDVPRMALRFPWLLHQMLAMSAFHIAYLHPDTSSEYTARATQHQTVAISGMREALSGGVTRDNSIPLYMTSALLMASKFASHLNSNWPLRPSCPLNGLLDIVCLVRGMSVVRTLATQRLSTHPLQHLFIVDPFIDEETSPARVTQHRLLALRAQLQASTQIEGDNRAIVEAGIESLLRSMSAANGPRIVPTTELRVVFNWLLVITSEFVGLLHERNPATLVVVSYYCVILRAAESSCWFLSGWATRLADSISASLTGSPWAELVQWSLAEIRRHDSEHVE